MTGIRDNSGTHWLTKYDPDDGEPYGTTCGCPVGQDHDTLGNLTDPDISEETPVTEPNENVNEEQATPPEYKAIDASFTALATGIGWRLSGNPALHFAEAQAHATVAQAVTLTGIRESLQQIASLMEDAAPQLQQLPAIAEALQVAAATFLEVTRDPGEPEAQADAERSMTTEDIEDSLVKRFKQGEVAVDADLRPGEEPEEIHLPAPGEPEDGSPNPESAHRSQDMGRPEQNPPTVRGDE